MNEAEWLACGDPQLMLRLLGGETGERKWRLFACACCRRLSGILPDTACERAALLGEQLVDGILPTAGGEVAKRELLVVWANCWDGYRGHKYAARMAYGAVHHLLVHFIRTSVRVAAVQSIREGMAEEARIIEQLGLLQPDLLRDIFGNPFRPVTFDPAWRSSDVQLLARGIYDERAFDRLPILADALQDAGCDCDDLLTHLRDTTAPHVRGCWALDLVLGKE